MSVRVRPYRGGGWEVDITIRLPNGSQYRERKCGSRFSKSSAYRSGQDRERYLLQHGPPTAKKEVPTFEAFAPRFVDGHARATVTGRVVLPRSSPSSDGIWFPRLDHGVSTQSRMSKCNG
jgi:hypothetical protein